MDTTTKSLHYWNIHRRVALREWNKLRHYNPRIAEIIAADAEHKTPEFNTFVARVNGEADRLYTDPTYYDNDPFTFGHVG